MVDANEYPQLAKSIFYWLNYQNSVSRSDVLLESAIRFPLAEFIERRYKVVVDLEASHPDFDRLRMDFCYTIDHQRRNIEVKYLHDYSDREAEFKRYFDDLVRLALLDGVNYFILCGPRDLYHTKVLKERRRIKKNGIPQDGGERPLEIIGDNKFEMILPLSDLGSELEFNPFDYYHFVGDKDKMIRRIPERLVKVRTQLVAQEDDENIGNQVVYIWRVSF